MAKNPLRDLGLALPRRRRSRPDDAGPTTASALRHLRFYLIKPSRYEDDGWVVRYRWGVIPNNTLTVVAGLIADAARATGCDIEIVLWDELVDGVLTERVVESIGQRAERDGVEAIIGLAGVQTSQYPRARDLALQFRRLGLPVIIGGFHVSSHPPSVEFLQSHGVSVVIGEAEGTIATVLADYLGSGFRPLYRLVDGIRARTGNGSVVVPRIEDSPLPRIDDRYVQRFFNPTFGTIDTSRGCPFACSYCSVKNVMGRSMRPRNSDRLVDWVRRAHDEHGIQNLLVVDDDLFRSPTWQGFFEGVAELRRDGRAISLIIQTDIESAAHGAEDEGASRRPVEERSRRFVDLAAEAGCFEVFMGFESFDPANLVRTGKLHNQERSDRRGDSGASAAERVKDRYRRVVDNWHAAGVGVHAGYMIGLPHDTAGCGRRAASNLSEIGIDIASFFAYTPLPGTEDYDEAIANRTITESDFNQFDSTHFVSSHPTLTHAERAREYSDAYRYFYTWRRLGWSIATGYARPGLGSNARYGMLAQQFYFTYATRRGWHPMMGGIGRLREGERRACVSDAEAALRFGQPPDSTSTAEPARMSSSLRTAVPD